MKKETEQDCQQKDNERWKSWDAVKRESSKLTGQKGESSLQSYPRGASVWWQEGLMVSHTEGEGGNTIGDAGWFRRGDVKFV